MCGEALRTVDKTQGLRFYDYGHEELRAEATTRSLSMAIKEGNAAKAKVALDRISKDSVYYADAQRAFSTSTSLVEEPARAKNPEPATPEPPQSCDKVDELVMKGQETYASGRAREALVVYGFAHACKPSDPTILRYALAAACKSKNLAKARTYWKKLNATGRTAMASLCAGNGFYAKDLDE
jgi:hypothetical protein